MKQGKSEVIIVLDRSGSMAEIKKDMEGGFKSFLAKQKKEPGECFVSLYQFDTEYEAVFEAKDIQKVDEIELVPRGGTALLDAIGKTVNAVGERLNTTLEANRPEVVIFLVFTDGEENSSREFNKTKIREMVQHQTEKYNWKFVFLGANQDAVLNGTSMGANVGTSLSFAATASGVLNTMNIACSGVSCMRSAADAQYTFSAEQRVAAMAP